jgi:cytochrome c
MPRLILSLTLAAVLTACGNGGSSSPPQAQQTGAPAVIPTEAATPEDTATAIPDQTIADDQEIEAALDYASLPAPYNTASQDKGERLFRQCVACHRIDDTGKHKTGPNLYGIIGKSAGMVEGFNYSKANKEADVIWTPDVMDEYLTNPRAFMPGTRMSYAGLRREDDRIEVIAYLMAKSATATE